MDLQVLKSAEAVRLMSTGYDTFLKYLQKQKFLLVSKLPK